MNRKYLDTLLHRLGLLTNRDIFSPNVSNEFVPKVGVEIEKKIGLIKPDAYYVFNNQPYILFFDLTNETDLRREEDIHKKVWSLDYVPVIFVIKKTDIEIFNAFHYERKKNKLEKIELSDEQMLEQFSFWNIQSGRIWQWLQSEAYKDSIHKKRVNQRLFDNINEARSQLESDGLTPFKANVIILRLIFIRYLIDRGVGIKKEFISGETVSERRSSLSSLIFDIPKLNEFFEYLNDRFNGALFKDSTVKLTKTQASFLSRIFDIRKPNAAPSLFDESYYFDVFDFSIIPVEVISGIYESVIDEETRNRDSAIYTPPFLVEAILTETLDKVLLNKKTVECKILDPSCGSGIFLVQAYRRMVDEELKRSQKSTIESSRLREIAERNLFGIDLNEQALLVASFSIYIAILDYKEPKEINRFIFPDLRESNLFTANFFDTGHTFNEKLKSVELDFIVGNPPWKNGKSDYLHVEYLTTYKLLEYVSDYQLAQSFVLRTKDFISNKTACALIVTSKSFYNINAHCFKQKFLSEYYLDKFLDLSPVRRHIFKEAKNPGCVIFYRYAFGESTLENITRHESLKPNIFLKYFNSLVLQKHDRKEIKQQYFIEYTWMFKLALYGGSLDFAFVKRLQDNVTIKEKLQSKSAEWKNLHFGDGIKRLTAAAREKSKRRPERFNQIKNIPIIETEQIKEFYTKVNNNNLPHNSDLYVKSGDNINLYLGERILFKARPRNESNLVISYVDVDSVFREKTLGISTQSNTILLKSLYAYFISDLFSYYQFITSSSWGVYYPEILQHEYLSFPYVEIDEQRRDELLISVNSIIESAKQYETALLKSPSPYLPFELKLVNEVINHTYELSPAEQDLIDYTLNVSRYQFQNDDSRFLRKVHLHPTLLKEYVEVFFNELEGIYEGEYLKVTVYPLNYFIAINFEMVPNKPLKSERIQVVNGVSDEQEVLSTISETLTIWNITDNKNRENNIYIQKDIKGFEKDSFYIIKPNEFGCWHKAMAWYDIAEIKSLIENAEEESFNEVE